MGSGDTWIVWRNKKARAVPAPLPEPLRWKLLADGGSSLRAIRLLLDDAGRLAAQTAQVIQLGAAHLAAAHHGDRVDHRRHHGEYALHAFAVGNLAHREAFVKPATGAADADAFIGLHARAIAFDHLDVDDDGVAGPEFRNGLAGGQLVELLFFELLNKVHRKISIGGAPQPPRRGLRECSSILPLRGFGARIRQRAGVVTLPSCFLGAFGSTNRAAASWSGPRPLPGARPRPGRGRRTTGFRGSAGPRTPAAGYIAGIPIARRKSSHPPQRSACPSRRAAAG